MKLTPRQKAFAQYYIQLGNATEAAVKAGYSKKTSAEMGYENLNKPHINLYIKEQMRQKDNQRIASAEEVLSFLTSVQRGEVTEQTPLVLGKEFKVIDKEPSIRDRTKAAELLGKRYALFTERVEANVSSDIVVSWGDEDGTED